MRAGPATLTFSKCPATKSLILDAVSERDLRAMITALVEQAKGGDVAARQSVDRLVGRPAAATDPEQRALELRDRQVEANEDRLWLRT